MGLRARGLRMSCQSVCRHSGGSGLSGVPLTLAIIEGLVVESGERQFVVPLTHVESGSEMDGKDAARPGSRNMVQTENGVIPFIRLRETFGIHGDIPAVEHFVTVRTGQGRLSVVVDKIRGNIRTVVKPLGQIYQNADGISGAAIMGDGTVALMVDIPGLVRCVREGFRSFKKVGKS